jgi:anti-sigma regulatory factor (Ser/Thr protein kinase)
MSCMDFRTTSNGDAPASPHFTTLSGELGGGDTHPAGNQLSIWFDSGPDAAGAARSALGSLEERVHPRVLDDLRLLVSELVTNAIRYAGGPAGGDVRLDVSIDGRRVHVEVADPGAGFDPQPRDDEMTRPGGWGLYLVDRIADRWGVVRNRMNRVWFEIDGATA